MINYRICCRLCLKIVKSTINCLNLTDLREKIEVLTSIKISESDCYSTNICRECSYQITNFAIYRETILNNQKTLEDYRNLDLMLGNMKSEGNEETGSESETEVIIISDDKTEVPSSTQSKDVTVSSTVDNTTQNNSKEKDEKAQIQKELLNSPLKRKSSEMIKKEGKTPIKKVKIVLEPLKESEIPKIKPYSSKPTAQRIENKRKTLKRSLERIQEFPKDSESQSPTTSGKDLKQAKNTSKPSIFILDNKNNINDDDDNDDIPLHLLKMKSHNPKQSSNEKQLLEKPISNKDQSAEEKTETTSKGMSPTGKDNKRITNPNEKSTKHQTQPNSNEQIFPVVSLTLTGIKSVVPVTLSSNSCSPLVPTSSTSKLASASVNLKSGFTAIPVSSVGQQMQKPQTVILANKKSPTKEIKQNNFAKLISSAVIPTTNLSKFSTLGAIHKSPAVTTPTISSSPTINNANQSSPKTFYLIRPATNKIPNSTTNIQNVSFNHTSHKTKDPNRCVIIPQSIASFQNKIKRAENLNDNEDNNSSNQYQDHRVKILTVNELNKRAVTTDNEQQQQQNQQQKLHLEQGNPNTEKKRFPIRIVLFKLENQIHINIIDRFNTKIEATSLNLQEKTEVRENLLRTPLKDKLGEVVKKKLLHPNAKELLKTIGIEVMYKK